MGHRYNPDAPEGPGAVGPFAFPPNVVRGFECDVAPHLPRHLRPPPGYHAALAWLIDAARTTEGKPPKVEPGGRMIYRATRAYARVQFVVVAAERADEWPLCIGVNLHAGASTRA